jgi:hypothetical protein
MQAGRGAAAPPLPRRQGRYRCPELVSKSPSPNHRYLELCDHRRRTTAAQHPAISPAFCCIADREDGSVRSIVEVLAEELGRACGGDGDDDQGDAEPGPVASSTVRRGGTRRSMPGGPLPDHRRRMRWCHHAAPDPADHLRQGLLLQGETEAALAEGVPVTERWFVEGTDYLGTVIIRHRLTPALERAGGHVGYHVVPGH